MRVLEKMFLSGLLVIAFLGIWIVFLSLKRDFERLEYLEKRVKTLEKCQ